MHRHYGMPLETVGHAHNGDDGPTHGPHSHERSGLGEVVTLAQLFQEAKEARTDDEEQNAHARIRKALAALLIRVNGHLNQNPYTIPEFAEGLKALYAHETGVEDCDTLGPEYRHAWMDVDLKAIAGIE